MRTFTVLVTAVSVVLLASPTFASQDCQYKKLHPTPASDGTIISKLLKPLPIDTRWDDLPKQTQSQLSVLAETRLSHFSSEWDASALASKEKNLLRCPTAAMNLNINRFLARFTSAAGASNPLSTIKNQDLGQALKKAYLAEYAAKRATLRYPRGAVENLDWDGTSPFGSIRLPERKSYADIKDYSLKVADELRGLANDDLSPTEIHFREEALYKMRAYSAGAFTGDSWGGADNDSACQLMIRNYDILGGYQLEQKRPEIYQNDDEVLLDANAIFLNNMPLKWQDVGTWNSAKKYCNVTNPSFVAKLVGDPAVNDTAKAMILFKNWWIERIEASPDSKKKCTIYTEGDRELVWTAFSADQQFNNDQSSSLESYNEKVGEYIADRTLQFRDSASTALDLVFPDPADFSLQDRQTIKEALRQSSAFGAYKDIIPAMLEVIDANSGKSLRDKWDAAWREDVVEIGGYQPDEQIRKEDIDKINDMFEKTKDWVAKNYNYYPNNPKNFYHGISIKVTTSSNSTTTYPGNINIGIGTSRTLYEHYSTILHELRHAMEFARAASGQILTVYGADTGPAFEGSGIATEIINLPILANDVFSTPRSIALNRLAYAMHDARLAATSEATAARYFRSGCSEASSPNSIDYVVKLVEKYGLYNEFASNAAVRVHVNAQYLQYLWSGLDMLGGVDGLPHV
ncbi:hypothetical protein LJR098_002558 [Rhizobium sp. LjRoot98]|uniref:hypothetical protein n=1 Tax=Rhizobium sp. LjRoot98 TaxID=3342345 RepID=UPI003ECF24A7